MQLPRYLLTSGKNLKVFEFVSEGPMGNILKLIQFTPTNLKDVYNLSFGDKNPDSGEIDDRIISNNNDVNKVLATVVASVFLFTDKYPGCWVYATGSTKSRTRLYRMGITKHLTAVKADFHLYGESGEYWEPFKKEKNYLGFAVKRKNI